MLKKVLIIILVILIIIVLGIYFFTTSQKTENNKVMLNNFEIEGMKVDILKQGNGMAAKVGDYVTTHYVGTLADGKEFDSSVKRNTPFVFQLGENRVIRGWELGVLGMKVGEQRKLTVPFELAYGPDGFPPTIPQKATLTFVISLLNINSPSPK